jgi:hypothetical protein
MLLLIISTNPKINLTVRKHFLYFFVVATSLAIKKNQLAQLAIEKIMAAT